MSDYFHVKLNSDDKGIMVGASGVDSPMQAVVKAVLWRCETERKHPQDTAESCDEKIEVSHHCSGSVYTHHLSRQSVVANVLKQFRANIRSKKRK